MRHIVTLAISLLAISLVVLAAPVGRARAEVPVHNFVINTVCDAEPDFPNPTTAPSAWFLIPEASETLQRLSEHGAPAGLPSQVWIDLSLTDNGFAPGTFVGAGPFNAPASGTYSFIWQGLLPGRVHYYRLNARVGDAWFLIGSGVFQMPDCTTPLHQTDCYTSPNGQASFVVPAATAIENHMPASRQWLDLSLFDNGFLPGTFVGTGPLPASGASFQWQGILPGRVHYYRLNVDYGAFGWRPQETGSFLSLDCRGLPANISLPV